MSFKLYTYENNNRAWKALIAAQYSGINIEVPAFKFGVDNKTEQFKAKNPLGKVPVLETPSGCIFESNAIARYVARLRADTNLLGDNNFQQGQVDQWIDFATNELEAARNIWIYPIQGYLPQNEKATAEAKKEVQTILGVLNAHLLHNTFLVGNHVTLADIIVVTNLVDLYAQFESSYIAPFGNVTRWYNTCINQPQFAKVLGKSAVTAKTTAAPEKKEAPAAKAAAPAKAAAAKPAAAKPAADDGGDDDEDAPKKKPKSELDLLPESKMVLDTIKKLCFSERPMKKTFFDELWPQYDDAGYSFWFSDYKYNAENEVLYMTGNLLGGFIQRSDAVRKYAMAAMIITGNKDEETPPFKVRGAWLFRGTGIPKEMTVENPDSEYYDWKKVDTKSDADKAKLRAIFQDETIDGEAVLERRFFK